MRRYWLALLAGVLLIPLLASFIDSRATVCDADRQCMPGRWCLAGRCRAKPRSCSRNGDCAAGEECACLEIRDPRFGDTSYEHYCLATEVREHTQNLCREPRKASPDVPRFGPPPE